MSPALLKNVPEKRSKDAHKWICLGMGEWTESSSGEEEGNALPTRQPAKKLKLINNKQVPVNFLEGTDNPAALCKWLISSVRCRIKRESKTGASTLRRRFTACWLAYFDIAVLKTRAVPTFSITVTTDLMNVVDNVFRELRQTGVGSETKSYSKGIVLLWFLLFHWFGCFRLLSLHCTYCFGTTYTCRILHVLFVSCWNHWDWFRNHA